MNVDRRVVQVNEYELQTSADVYVAAIEALAKRTEAEGHRGVLVYQFYVDNNADTAGAVIVYDDADAWAEHHQMAYQWEEMPALQSCVSLQRLTLFGPLTPAIKVSLATAGIAYVHYESFAAGFFRA